jgi:hypothetical protein
MEGWRQDGGNIRRRKMEALVPEPWRKRSFGFIVLEVVVVDVLCCTVR